MSRNVCKVDALLQDEVAAGAPALEPRCNRGDISNSKSWGAWLLRRQFLARYGAIHVLQCMW